MYVRRKSSPGREDYYQLVEAQRVDGKPRQRVVLHLGQHASVEDALKKWPRKISSLRRRGRAREADALKVKLDFLRNVLPKGLWSIDKHLGGSEGVRWVRARLEPYDWSACQAINVRRVRDARSIGRSGVRKTKGALKGLPNLYTKTRAGDYHITVRISHPSEYPLHTRHSGGAVIHNEDEALVWLIAHAAASYLVRTGQLSENRDDFADGMLEEFRSSR